MPTPLRINISQETYSVYRECGKKIPIEQIPSDYTKLDGNQGHNCQAREKNVWCTCDEHSCATYFIPRPKPAPMPVRNTPGVEVIRVDPIVVITDGTAGEPSSSGPRITVTGLRGITGLRCDSAFFCPLRGCARPAPTFLGWGITVTVHSFAHCAAAPGLLRRSSALGLR